MDASAETPVVLAQTIGIDPAEVARRRILVGLDEGDIRLLKDMRVRWTDATGFVDRFFECLVRNEEIRAAIPDEAALKRFGRMQSAYFDSLTEGNYGVDHALARLHIGMMQRRFGLDPKWYLGAYSHYLSSVLPELWALLGDDPGHFVATFAALQKVVFLDLGLVFDTYLHADRRAIVGLRRYASDIIASLPNGLAIVDADLVVLTANEAFRTLCDLSSHPDPSGHPLEQLLPFTGLRGRAESVIHGESATFTLEDSLGAKHLRVALMGIRLAEEEEEERLLVVVEDITQQRAHARRIEELAYHDSLTGLPNRALFMERLGHALRDAASTHGTFAVLYMDLDRFKEINDTRGHLIGNDVLIEIAQRLKHALREDETVARLGGDEFGLIAQVSDRTGAAQIATRLLRALGEPLQTMEKAFSVGVSIGIAMFPWDGKSVADLYKHADIAMYQAKAAGNGYCFYEHEMALGLDASMQLAQKLGQAMKARSLELYFQPQVDSRTGALTGAEALLRWHDLESGWISPAEFIPVAEERGMMGVIGTWVIEAACAQLRAWRQEGLRLPGRLAFNVSAQQFEDVDIVSRVVSIVSDAGLRPSDFEIELTEGALMKNVEGSARILESLKAAGFAFALDDFGSGYSSLTHLQRLPVDRLKIDISFVREMLSGARQRKMVAAIVGMARTLDIAVVAEGVETEAQNTALLGMGCHEVQGYLFGRPVPPEEFARQWLATEEGVTRLDSN